MNGDVVGEINYLVSTTDGCPAWALTGATAATLKSNFIQESVPLTMHDLRGKEKSVNLDTNAVEVVTYNGSIQEEFEEDSEVQKTYYEEITNLLKKRLGASNVIIYQFTFRFRTQPRTDEQCGQHHRNPVFYPHVDTDAAGVQEILEKKLTKEDIEKVKQNRIQVINLWRPIGPNPITHKPLTICDYQSLDLDKDVHPLEFRRFLFNHTGRIVSRNAQDSHIWYYLSQMRSDEMFIFKMFDSKPDVAQFAFHTAFTNKNVPIPDVEEKSLEIRCLVLYDN